MIKVQALNAHAPSLVLANSRTQSSMQSIRTVSLHISVSRRVVVLLLLASIMITLHRECLLQQMLYEINA